MDRVLVVGPVRVPSLSGIQIDRYKRHVQGLSHLATSGYSAVVVDLPSGKGIDHVLDMIATIQERSPGTPIIVVARRNSLAIEKSIRERGVFYYFCGVPDPKNWEEILKLTVAYSHAHHPHVFSLSYAS
jgi:ActR/RegA family two-component response regulator